MPFRMRHISGILPVYAFLLPDNKQAGLSAYFYTDDTYSENTILLVFEFRPDIPRQRNTDSQYIQPGFYSPEILRHFAAFGSHPP